MSALESERVEPTPSRRRWRNAEVDNTKREWDSEIGDFRDNYEGHPPEWDCSDGAGMTRDPALWDRLAKLRKAS